MILPVFMDQCLNLIGLSIKIAVSMDKPGYSLWDACQKSIVDDDAFFVAPGGIEPPSKV